MHLPAHIMAFQAQWVIKYLDPRDSPWKDVLDHWFSNTTRLGRGVIMSPRGPKGISKLPPTCSYLQECFASFAELDLQQDLTILDFKSTGEPLWHSPRFRIPLARDSIEQWTHGLSYYRISDVHGKDGLKPNTLLQAIIDHRRPEHVRERDLEDWRADRGNETSVFPMHIPRNIKEMLKDPLPDLKEGDIVHIILESTKRSLYAKYLHGAGGEPYLEELFLDTTRYPHLTGDVIDNEDVFEITTALTWDSLNKHHQEPYAGDEDPHETPEERSAVMGPFYNCFPLNEGWYARGQTRLNDKGKPRRLSDLTIHEMTVILTDRITAGVRPNCEAAWRERLPAIRTPNFSFQSVCGAPSVPPSPTPPRKRAIDASYTEPSTPRTATPSTPCAPPSQTTNAGWDADATTKACCTWSNAGTADPTMCAKHRRSHANVIYVSISEGC